MAHRVTFDIVTFDPANDEFVLYLIEDGPWPDSEVEWHSVLGSVQDRILSAVEAAMEGHIVDKFPDSAGKKVRIQIDSPHGSPSQLDGLIDAVAVFLADDPTWSTGISESQHLAGLRVVSGKQVGRFPGVPRPSDS